MSNPAPSLSVLETWTWPWAPWTLHVAYLLAAMLVAVHYVPLLRCAWLYPDATRTAHSLKTWAVWAMCSSVSCAYGVFVLHNAVFLMVVCADFLGRFGMVLLIVRARWLRLERASRFTAARTPSAGPVHRRYSARLTRCTFS